MRLLGLATCGLRLADFGDPLVGAPPITHYQRWLLAQWRVDASVRTPRAVAQRLIKCLVERAQKSAPLPWQLLRLYQSVYLPAYSNLLYSAHAQILIPREYRLRARLEYRSGSQLPLATL